MQSDVNHTRLMRQIENCEVEEKNQVSTNQIGQKRIFSRSLLIERRKRTAKKISF